ncbi:MAG TPA: hypothetical protein VLX31_18720 [Streptosporangiaceae bacterium]|nr:hypothetical protein [Streptosporangiaceae bacterium]
MKDTHLLWIGILAGMLVWAFAPGWLKAITVGAALVFSGLLAHVTTLHSRLHFHLTVPPLVIAAAGVGFGLFAWHYARKRGLAHLGEAELANRWSNVRRVSSLGW